MFAELFKKRLPPAPAQDVPAPDTRAPTQRRQPAQVCEFARWLVQADKTSAIPKRRLQSLYWEFCEYTDAEPLTEGQLFRRLRAAGIERYREPVGVRQWFYRVRSAEVVELTRPRSVA
jgi:hypothetical protein